MRTIYSPTIFTYAYPDTTTALGTVICDRNRHKKKAADYAASRMRCETGIISKYPLTTLALP